jgi:O-antigen ligase
MALPAALAKVRRLATVFRWWHWLWLLVYTSGLVFRVRTTETIYDSPVDFWAGFRIGLMGLVAMVLLGRLATRTTEWGGALLRGLPAGVFLCGLISLISTLWSIYPMWTLYKAVEYLIDVALLVAILTSVRSAEDIKSLFDLTWLMTGLVLLSVWLGVLFRPDAAIIRGIGLIGIQILGVLPAVATNGVGDLGGTLLVVAATRLLFRNDHRSLYWIVCLAALVTLILAQSRSPFTGTLLGLLAVFFLARRYGLLSLVGITGAVLLTLTSVAGVVQQAFLRGQSPEQFHSLSGRVGWWAPAWELLRENPFLGLGGWAAGRFAVLGQLGDTDTSSLHNGWLEILVGVGLIGFLPFLVTFLRTWLNLLRPLDTGSSHSAGTELRTELRIEAIGIFVLICFRSMFTAEFIWHPPVLFFLVVGYSELLRRGRFEGLRAAQPVPAAWRRGHRIHVRGAAAGIEGRLGRPLHRP